MRRVRQQSDLSRAQDRSTKLSLIARAHTRDSTRKDLPGRGDEELEQLRILVVDLPGGVLLERIDLSSTPPVNSLILCHRELSIQYGVEKPTSELLDLGFDEFNVLSDHRIVLLHLEFIRGLSLVLRRRVVVASAGRRNQSDFFSHDARPFLNQFALREVTRTNHHKYEHKNPRNRGRRMYATRFEIASPFLNNPFDGKTRSLPRRGSIPSNGQSGGDRVEIGLAVEVPGVGSFDSSGDRTVDPELCSDPTFHCESDLGVFSDTYAINFGLE